MTERRQSMKKGTEKSAEIGSYGGVPRGEGLTAVQQFIGAMNQEEPVEKKRPSNKKKTKEHSKEQLEQLKQLRQLEQQPRPEQPIENKGEDAASGAQDTLDGLDADIAALEDAPELTYVDRITKHNISLEKAEEIVDSMIVDGYYEETYAVTQKYNVTFRTRTLEDQNRIMERIEVLRPQYPTTLSNIVAQYNVASSLVHFRDIDFTTTDFERKLDWVRKCPDAVIRALATKLNQFDGMITDVMSEGAIENF